ncbi:hypothetical protein GJ744_012368 [Endocarpon pusillum]|uniref:Uncharacterized protein n=1 Tax=Endocarpon pusillum TaxID=364733 RepID=A0A8H7E468_9EURO|nr:hypothetical protein GJ744_012368 [Endocarpon pusillum]
MSDLANTSKDIIRLAHQLQAFLLTRHQYTHAISDQQQGIIRRVIQAHPQPVKQRPTSPTPPGTFLSAQSTRSRRSQSLDPSQVYPSDWVIDNSELPTPSPRPSSSIGDTDTATSVSFPERDRIPIDELYLLQNQRPWKMFPPKGNHENEEEWNGFNDDDSPAPNSDILPPPIESFESQNAALQAVQDSAREHGYALRIRSSRKRQKDDAHSFFIYLESGFPSNQISQFEAQFDLIM